MALRPLRIAFMNPITPNPDQKNAIQAPHDQPVRIVAGAGTGKTEVISQRFVHLLKTGGMRPDQILVLTFSEKAAAEMRARIFRAVSAAPLGYQRLDLANAPISTFHSFCARLLRDHSLVAGIDPALPMLTETDTANILDSVIMSFLERGFEKAYTFNPLDRDVYTWEDGGPTRLAVGVIEQLRNQAVRVAEFNMQWHKIEELPDRYAVLAPLVSHLYSMYLHILSRNGQMDFDRLIMGAVDLLEGNPVLRARVHHECRTILVDEYQDTNYAQERLLRAVASEGMSNVTVVGDPRQAIYVWREARVENIAEFPGDGGQRVETPLSQNWRSLKPILDIANKAIAGYELGDPSEFDADRRLEPAQSETSAADPVVTLQVTENRDAEAQAVAGWITKLHDEGRSYRDIAILIRARTYLDIYTDALERVGIPFELSAGDAFYTRPEIMDAIHLLRVCVDPMDPLALVVTLLSPVVGLSQAQIAHLAQMDCEQLWEVVVDPFAFGIETAIASRLIRFKAFWSEAQCRRWVLPPSTFAAWALQASGLEAHIDALSDPGLARALSKLMAIAHTYESGHPGDILDELVAHLQLQVATEPREKTPELAGETDAVQVMTAHASKGLEFPVVIAVDNRQRISPTRRKYPFHEPGVGLIFPEDDERDPHYLTRVRHTRNEARCLWYVTLTRAKERLIVTAAHTGKQETDGMYSPVRTLFHELWNQEALQPSKGVERIGVLPDTENG